MLDENTFGIQGTVPDKGLRGWYHRDRAAIKAALTFWAVFLILALITLFTGWASRPVTLVLQLILSLGAGLLAAWLHKRENPERLLYVRMGTLAGLYLPLTTALAILVVALISGIGSFGMLLPLMIPYFISLPVEMGACSMAGALGGWIFKLLAGKNKSDN